MNVPQNIHNTVSAKSFMTYMGIGQCDITIGTSQTLTDDVAGGLAEMADVLANDDSISKYTVLICKMFNMITDDGSVRRLRVELGDHTAFPISYSKGRTPLTETEIAISGSNADELNKSIGDEIILIVDGDEKRLTVCGIYSDITNGGFTAKAVFKADLGEILWGSIPVTFLDSSAAGSKVTQYRELFPFAKVSGIEEHMAQMFGPTVAAVQTASSVSIGMTIALTILVTLLFMKMLITKDRYTVAVLKSIGFTSANIRRQYITRGLVVYIIGIIFGTELSNTIGELVGVAILSYVGASSFNFVVNPLFSYLFSPLLIALCVCAATFLGVSDIRKIKISEHIKEV
jgi:putative ABC transport system permease protein